MRNAILPPPPGRFDTDENAWFDESDNRISSPRIPKAPAPPAALLNVAAEGRSTLRWFR